jgi:hypothetical protein
MRVPLDERSPVGEVFKQQISLRDECLEPLQSSPCVRVRAPRKPTKGDFDIASNIANMEPERRRGGLKFQPKALSLTSNARGPGVASGMGKPHLALRISLPARGCDALRRASYFGSLRHEPRAL